MRFAACQYFNIFSRCNFMKRDTVAGAYSPAAVHGAKGGFESSIASIALELIGTVDRAIKID